MTSHGALSVDHDPIESQIGDVPTVVHFEDAGLSRSRATDHHVAEGHSGNRA